MGFNVVPPNSLLPKQNTNRLISDTRVKLCIVGTLDAPATEDNATPLEFSPPTALASQKYNVPPRGPKIKSSPKLA